MTIVDCLILIPWVVASTILGEVIYNKWFRKEPQRIIYAVDITLRGAEETIDDFITRAYAEHLGQYRIV